MLFGGIPFRCNIRQTCFQLRDPFMQRRRGGPLGFERLLSFAHRKLSMPQPRLQVMHRGLGFRKLAFDLVARLALHAGGCFGRFHPVRGRRRRLGRFVAACQPAMYDGHFAFGDEPALGAMQQKPIGWGWGRRRSALLVAVQAKSTSHLRFGIPEAKGIRWGLFVGQRSRP